MRKFLIGDTFTNKEGDVAVVVDFIQGSKARNRKALVRFTDDSTGVFTTSKLSGGSFKNRNKPTVYGVGFIGQGEYTSSVKGVATKAYRKWEAMLQRCYDTKNEGYFSYGAIGVFVCEEWHSFQNFAKWFYDNEPKDRSCSYELDKDLLGNGKEYSPENCCLLPAKINSALNSLNKNGYYANNYGSYTVNDVTGKFMLNTKSEHLAQMLVTTTNIQKLAQWGEYVDQLKIDPRIAIKIKSLLQNTVDAMKDFTVIVYELEG